MDAIVGIIPPSVRHSTMVSGLSFSDQKIAVQCYTPDKLFNSAVDEFKGLEPGELYELDLHPDYSLYPFKLSQKLTSIARLAILQSTISKEVIHQRSQPTQYNDRRQEEGHFLGEQDRIMITFRKVKEDKRKDVI